MFHTELLHTALLHTELLHTELLHTELLHTELFHSGLFHPELLQTISGERRLISFRMVDDFFTNFPIMLVERYIAD